MNSFQLTFFQALSAVAISATFVPITMALCKNRGYAKKSNQLLA